MPSRFMISAMASPTFMNASLPPVSSTGRQRRGPSRARHVSVAGSLDLVSGAKQPRAIVPGAVLTQACVGRLLGRRRRGGAAMPDTAATAAGANATVALRLAEAFARHGVTLTFGQSLPSAFHLAAPHVGIDQKVYRQENAGGAMADGYARISRKVGVVTAQNGPAATLLVPPLAEALKASRPVLALVQEVTRDAFDRNAFQELDHLRMFEPVAKWVRRIDRADRLDDYVDMAFTAATSGRPGPAVLLVPADLLTEAAAPASSLLRPRRLSLGQVPLDRYAGRPRCRRRRGGGAGRGTASAGGGGRRRPPVGRRGGTGGVAGGGAPAGRHHRHGQGRGGRDASAHPRRGRLRHGAGRAHPRAAADGGAGRRRAAGRQPHQPERHRQLEAVRRGHALHPPRRSTRWRSGATTRRSGWWATPSSPSRR